MSAQASDVLIVGGGLMGCSAAFFLARRGRSVTLIERDRTGQHASGTNFGNVRRQGRPLVQLPLANRASAIWRRMKELLDEDVEYLEAGNLRVCYGNRPELHGKLEDYAREAAGRGLELEVLVGPALHRRFPFLGPEVLAGSWSARDGHANRRLVAPAFASAAVRNGARLFENTACVAAEKVSEDYHVECEDGSSFSAPVLLVTAGAWAGRLSAQFGEAVPIESHGPTMSVTEPAPYAIAPSIGVYTPDVEETVYFRQIPRGNIIIGGSWRGQADIGSGRARVEPRNTLSQFRQIRRLAPSLARLQVIRVWSGVECYLPDSMPVLGPSARSSGLYYAFGFSGSGFQIGPGVGDVLAELIDTGATDISLEPYRIDRFSAC